MITITRSKFSILLTRDDGLATELCTGNQSLDPYLEEIDKIICESPKLLSKLSRPAFNTYSVLRKLRSVLSRISKPGLTAFIDGLQIHSSLGLTPEQILCEAGEIACEELKEADWRSTFSVSEILNGVVIFQFAERHFLSRAFGRLAEYLEHPFFCGKYFSWEEFKKWYRDLEGGFSYFADWAGHNIPLAKIAPFLQSSSPFEPFSAAEVEILSLIRDHVPGWGYAIAVGDELDIGTLNHEIGHALWATNPEYQSKMKSLLLDTKIDLTEMKNFLAYRKYHESVWQDECHAYLTFCGEDLEIYGFDWSRYAHISPKFQEIFYQFAPQTIPIGAGSL